MSVHSVVHQRSVDEWETLSDTGRPLTIIEKAVARKLKLVIGLRWPTSLECKPDGRSN